ncbi:MAG: efflux RND transporter periplasmic adaptor subunit [Elusimicrobiota bacterium]
MDKRKIIAVAVLAVVGLTLYLTLTKRGGFMYAGTVEATEVDLSSRLTGVIGSVNAREGDKVSQGQALVKLSIEDIEVAAAAAERDYKRAIELLDAGSLNREAFDRIKFKRDDAAVRLSWGTVKSPIDGTVITRFHEPGEMVAPGVKLMTIADIKRPWAYIYVPQPVLSKISAGMEVKGYVPESGVKKTIPGRISHINQEAEFTPKNVQTQKERTRLVFGVKIAFENDDEFLKPGMTVEVELGK